MNIRDPFLNIRHDSLLAIATHPGFDQPSGRDEQPVQPLDQRQCFKVVDHEPLIFGGWNTIRLDGIQNTHTHAPTLLIAVEPALESPIFR